MGSCCACNGIKLYQKGAFSSISNIENLEGNNSIEKKGTKNDSPKKEDPIPNKIDTLADNLKIEERNKSMISSNSTKDFIDYTIIENSKISQDLIDKLNSLYKPLTDGIPVEQVQLGSKYGGEYRGEWNPEKKERHGRGILWNNNSLYLGYWQNNKMNGMGKKIHSVPDINSISNKIFSNEQIGPYYEGEWKDNYQDGEGEEFWPDNAHYKGQYRSGMKWGEGTLSFPDHFKYVGEFKEDEINGKGTITYKDGRMYEGEWLNNKMNGEGVFKWPDGKIYSGHYLNNLKDGFGEFKWPNGKVYKGNWVKGKQNDDGDIYDPVKKQWIHGKWKMGIKVKCNV